MIAAANVAAPATVGTVRGGMFRRIWAALAIAACSSGAAPAATASNTAPRLLSVRPAHGRIVLTASFGDLQPGEVLVARRPATGAQGQLLGANVALERTLTGAAAGRGGVIRWRSHGSLRPGHYWVQVTGRSTTGITDCLPHGTRCWEHWSNVIPVRVH